MRRNEWIRLYAAEYETDPATGKQKRVSRYIGPWYTLEAPQRRAGVIRSWIVLVLAAAAFAAAGLLPTWAGLSAWVLPCYLLCLLPLFYLLLGVVKLTRLKLRFTEVDKAESIGYVKSGSLWLMILAGVWAAADAVFLITSGLPLLWVREIIFLGCGAACCLLGLAGWLSARRICPVREDK